MTKNSNTIKILIITEYFPPEIGAGSNRAYDLAKHWASFGAKITVLTGFPDYPDGVRPINYRGLKFLREKKDDVEIIRTLTYSVPNIGFFRRILSYLLFLFSSIVQGTKAVGTQDIIIATSPPFFVGISGYVISRLKNIPFIFEVRDLWPESIVQLGQLKNKLLINILEKIEIFLYKKAIHIVPVADSSVEILISKKVAPDKITVIKNGVNVEEITPLLEDRNLKFQLGLSNKFIVSYFGTVGLSHALETVVETAKIAVNISDIFFLFIGNGAEKQNLLEKAQKLNLNNTIFLDSVEREQLARYYSITDVQIVSLKNIDLFRKVIPSKIFEIMSYEKPILISVDGEARKIVEESNSGLYVVPENAINLFEKIVLLKNKPELCAAMAKNGRNFVKNNFNRKKLALDYFNLIEKILSKQIDQIH